MTYSAPGKLFLFGEYAVLGGGWSIVTAVDRRIVVNERPGDAYSLDGAVADSALPSLVLEHAGAGFDARAVHADATAFFSEGEKLGLGSSAASCAAFAGLGLGLGLGAIDDPDRAFEVAAGAHREFQGGRGSHADVAASVYGGTVAYRLLQPVPPFPRIAATAVDGRRVSFAEVSSLALPRGVRVRAYWLGAPASSTELIGRVEPAIEAGRADALDALESIAAAAERAMAALGESDIEQIFDAVRLSHAAMLQLGESTGAAIVPSEALRLFESARSYGIEGKMSGAGGGDFVVLFGEPTADWAKLELRYPGLWLEISGDEPGLRSAS